MWHARGKSMFFKKVNKYFSCVFSSVRPSKHLLLLSTPWGGHSIMAKVINSEYIIVSWGKKNGFSKAGKGSYTPSDLISDNDRDGRDGFKSDSSSPPSKQWFSLSRLNTWSYWAAGEPQTQMPERATWVTKNSAVGQTTGASGDRSDLESAGPTTRHAPLLFSSDHPLLSSSSGLSQSFPERS